MSQKSKIILLVILIFRISNAMNIKIVSENEYNYMYPIEFESNIDIDSILITDDTDSVEFDNNSQLSILLDLNASVPDLSLSFGGNASSKINKDYTLTGKEIIINLEEAITKGDSLIISGFQYKSNQIQDSGKLLIKNTQNETLGTTSKSLVFGNTEIDLIGKTYPLETNDTLEVTISDGGRNILYPGRDIYLKFNNNISFGSIASLENSNFSLVNRTSSMLHLQIKENFSNTGNILFPINAPNYEIDDVAVQMSILKDNSNYYYDVTNNKFHIASCNLSLGKEQVFVLPDQNVRFVRTVNINNDDNQDLFYSGQIFYLIIPDNLPLQWELSESERNQKGISLEVDEANSKRLICASTSSHSSNGLIALNDLGITTLEGNARSEPIYIEFKNSDFSQNTSNQLRAVTPSSISFSDRAWFKAGQNRSLGDLSLNFNGDPLLEDYYFYIKIPDDASSEFSKILKPNWAKSVQKINSKLFRLTLNGSQPSGTTQDKVFLNFWNNIDKFILKMAILDDENYSQQKWGSDTLFVKDIRMEEPEKSVIVSNTNQGQPIAGYKFTQDPLDGPSVFAKNKNIKIVLPDKFEWAQEEMSLGQYNQYDSHIIDDTLKLNLLGTYSSLEIDGLMVRTLDKKIQPSSLQILFNDNTANKFNTANDAIRAGRFDFSHARIDTTSLRGDIDLKSPRLEIGRNLNILFNEYYTLIVSPKGNYGFIQSENLVKENADIHIMNGSINIQNSSENISKDIIIDNLKIDNQTSDSELYYQWKIKRRNRSGVLLKTDTIKTGDIDVHFADVESNNFRYPIYLQDDPNARDFPNIIIEDQDENGLLKNREFTFELPGNIKWSGYDSTKFRYNSNQSNILEISNLSVQNFEQPIINKLVIEVKNNNKPREIDDYEVKIVKPSLNFSIPNSVSPETTQTFWWGKSGPADWYLKPIETSDIDDFGFLPEHNSKEFGLRIKIPGIDLYEVSNIEDRLRLDDLNTDYSNDILHITTDKSTWSNNQNSEIYLSKILLRIEDSFDSKKIEYCLTEPPFYWMESGFSLYSTNPDVHMSDKAYIKGDQNRPIPSIEITNIQKLPESNKANLMFVLPPDFPGQWRGDHAYDEDSLYCDTSLSYTENIFINDLKISVNDILTPSHIQVFSGENNFAKDQTDAFRESDGTIQVGDPKVNMSSQSMDSTYKFCYNDPGFKFQDIILEEASVPSLLKGDTVYFRLENNTREGPVEIVNLDIEETSSSYFGSLEINNTNVKVPVKQNLSSKQSYIFEDLQLDNFNKSENELDLKIYLREPDEKGHPEFQSIGKIKIGKPSITGDNYYINIEKGQKQYNIKNTIKITEDNNFPVIDSLALCIDQKDTSHIKWDKRRSIFMKGQALRSLHNNRVQYDSLQTKMQLNIASLFPANESLSFQPFSFIINDTSGTANVKLSTNNGKTFIDTVKIYYSNAKFSLEGANKILKSKKSTTLNLSLINLIGIDKKIWLRIPDTLDCSWGQNTQENVQVDNYGIDIDSLSSINSKLLMIKFNRSPDTGQEILVSGLNIFIGERSSKGRITALWDNPYTSNLKTRTDRELKIGAPLISTSSDIILFNNVDNDTNYTFKLRVQDDPVVNFFNMDGNDKIQISLPDSIQNNIDFIPDNVFRISTNPDYINIKLRTKTQGMLPSNLIYNFKSSDMENYKYISTDNHIIGIAKPDIIFKGDDINSYINPEDSSITLNTELNLSKGNVCDPILKSDTLSFLINKSQYPWLKEYNWSHVSPGNAFSKINTDEEEKIFLRLDKNLKDTTNLSSQLKFKLSFDDIINNRDIKSFPNNIQIGINFRPKDNNPAIFYTQDHAKIHLPLFAKGPRFSDHNIEFTIIKDFLNTEYISDLSNHIGFISKEYFKDLQNTPSFDFNQLDLLPEDVVVDTDANLLNYKYKFSANNLKYLNYKFSGNIKNKSCEYVLFGLVDSLAQQITNDKSNDYYNWYRKKLKFEGYKPYDSSYVQESNLFFPTDSLLQFQINFENEKSYHLEIKDLINNNVFYDTSGITNQITDKIFPHFTGEGLYSLKITGNDEFPIFPYYRYVVFDSTSPNFYNDTTSLYPRIVKDHNKRSDFKYKGLSVSLYDSLMMRVYDNLTSDYSGNKIYYFSNNSYISEKIDTCNVFLPDNFIQKILICSTFVDNGLLKDPYIDTLSNTRIDDNYAYLFKTQFQNLVGELDEPSDVKFLIVLKDNANNVYRDSLYYRVLVPEEEKDNNLSNHVFNYPNPFKTGHSTTFRYVIKSKIESNREGKLVVFDAGGEIVYYRKLKNKDLSVGVNKIKWNGKTLYGEELAPGVYFGFFKIPGEEPSHLKIAIIGQ